MQLHRDIRAVAAVILLQENGKSNFPHTGSKFCGEKFGSFREKE